MKYIRSIIVFVIFIFILSTPCHAASEALDKIPVPTLYPYQVEKYAKERFKFDISKLHYSDDRVNKEIAIAGWDAFKTNCDLQGAAFTVSEECLGATFLKGINNIQGEIGGGMVVMQLAIDISQQEYGTAAFNLAEGSIQYAIGKWGTSMMKVTSVAYTATKIFLVTTAKKFKKAVDEFYYTALRHYFTTGGGVTMDGKAWIDAFKAFNNGQGVQNREDVLKVVDDYVKRFWDPEEFYSALGEIKESAGGIFTKGVYEVNEKHFEEYIKGQVILPYLEPVLDKMVKDNIEKQSRDVTDKIKELVGEFNREYTLKGFVAGPKDKVAGLTARIPGFLTTTTDANGRFQFKFTLYALMKSNQALKVELLVPTDDGVQVLTKTGKITEKYRKEGGMSVKFDISSLFEEETLPKKPEEKTGMMDARSFYQGLCEAHFACGYNVPFIQGGQPPYTSVEDCVQYQVHVEEKYYKQDYQKSYQRNLARSAAKQKASNCPQYKKWLEHVGQ